MTVMTLGGQRMTRARKRRGKAERRGTEGRLS